MDYLNQALRDKDPKVRIAAAEAIGEIGEKWPEEVRPLRMTQVSDDDRQVRIAAIEALNKLGLKPHSPDTGIYNDTRGYYPSGVGTLLIKNAMNKDSLVTLLHYGNKTEFLYSPGEIVIIKSSVVEDGVPILSVFVPAESSYEVEGIYPGTFRLRYVSGNNWDSDTFLDNITMMELPEPLIFHGPPQWSNLAVTLSTNSF